MIWLLSFTVWSMLLAPCLYIFSRSGAANDRLDQRWQNLEPNYELDQTTMTLKRQLR